ncbi:MAG: hypothetical protein H6767_04975 [Candidatus Peribacteria bacterium]|nr:MAG: hypothetical protein H6767_04975 [Candidatus Peribacteria bacterium]
MGCGPVTNGYFLINAEVTNDAYYSQKTKNCNHVVFCFGLQNQDYSILNMQYSKEEYARQLSQIREDLQAKGLWGKMLDPKYAPFPLNDTNISEEFPVEKVIYVDTLDSGTASFSELSGRIVSENPQGKGKVYVLEPEKFISQAVWDL